MRRPMFYFENIFNEYHDKFLEIGTLIKYPAGSMINDIGDEFNYCEYIISGKTAFSVLNPVGETKTICFFGNGSMFPPYSSPNYHYYFETNSLFVKALTDVAAIRMSQEQFYKIICNDTQLCIKMLDFLGDLTEVMLFEISSKSYTDNFTNVCTFLWVLSHDLYSNGIVLSQQDIADAVGVSRVFVAQSLKKLREAGIISTSKMKIHVLDLDALAELSSPEISMEKI